MFIGFYIIIMHNKSISVFQQAYWHFHIKQANKKLVIPTVFLNLQETSLALEVFDKIQTKNQACQPQDQQFQEKINQGNDLPPSDNFKYSKKQGNQASTDQRFNLERQKCQQIMNNKFKAFQQGSYVKIGQKSAKDLWKGQHNVIMLKITNYKQFCSLLQFSDYLVQHIESNRQKSGKIKMGISIRKYLRNLQRQDNQYSVYIKQGVVIGICQKYPHHMEKYKQENQKINKLQKIQKVCYQILQILQQSLEQEDSKNQLSDMLIELYQCESKTYILGIHAYHVSPISLFTQQQLDDHFACYKNDSNWSPIFKTATSKDQLKQQDLGLFSADKQFMVENSKENIQQWMQFMKSAKF